MQFEKEIHQLYHQAFPFLERVHFWVLKNMVKRKKAQFIPILSSGNFVGFFFVVENSSLTYIFFFALRKEYRNLGYGGKALDQYLSTHSDKRICLLTERIDKDEPKNIRVRRKNFYLRHGLKEAGCYFKENHVWYEMLCNFEHFDENEYSNLMKEAFSSLEYHFFFNPQESTKKLDNYSQEEISNL